MSSRKVKIQETQVQDISGQAITPITAVTTITTVTNAKVPRKGCCGYCRETEEERYESVLETTIVDEHFKHSIRCRYIYLFCLRLENDLGT